MANSIDAATMSIGSVGRVSSHRHLEIGDFAELNTIFEGAEILLGDATASTRVAGLPLNLDMSNIRCKDISIGDFLIGYTKRSLQRLEMGMEIVQLDLSCTVDFTYKYSVFPRGSDSVEAFTNDNGVAIAMVFNSENFDEFPPNEIVVEGCTAKVDVTDLDFVGGGFDQVIFNAIETLLRSTVESEVNALICSEMSSLGDTFGQSLLDLVDETLEPYFAPLPPNYADPLFAENNMAVPDGKNLLDLSNTEEVVGGWFNDVLQEIDALLGTVVDDPDSPTGTGRDLGVNKLLRENVLDSDRALTIASEDFEGILDSSVFEGHDRVTQTNITLDQLKIFGLDTFTEIKPLRDIGKYTLQNDFSWRFLTVEVDLSFTIKTCLARRSTRSWK